VLVCLLADGHLLIEGVPGLAKMLTIKTTAQVLGGTFIPVFCNFLLADEINRAPAQVQSALLEVMQERQVTIGKETFEAPSPFLVMATQNPIESEGTYPLPEARVDRFMLKVVVGYPGPEDELTVVERTLAGLAEVRSLIALDELISLRGAVKEVYVDPALSRYAVQIAGATRIQRPSVCRT
jgi:MoxR-like ATPase